MKKRAFGNMLLDVLSFGLRREAKIYIFFLNIDNILVKNSNKFFSQFDSPKGTEFDTLGLSQFCQSKKVIFTLSTF